MKIPTSQLSKGQSLFEAVVAIAISALIIVAVVSLVANAIRNSSFSKNKTLAARYAQEATEWLRGQRDSDFEAFSANALTPEWCMNDLNWNQVGACGDGDFIRDTNFSREIDFSLNTVNGKNFIGADVVVYWIDSQGYHEVRSATNFADWRQR
jgi:Tfp pilus assembly protein PilV